MGQAGSAPSVAAEERDALQGVPEEDRPLSREEFLEKAREIAEDAAASTTEAVREACDRYSLNPLEVEPFLKVRAAGRRGRAPPLLTRASRRARPVPRRATRRPWRTCGRRRTACAPKARR